MPLPRFLHHAAIWLALAAFAFVAYSFRDEARFVLDRVAGDLHPERGYGAGESEISFRAGGDGHFAVEVLVDGTPLVMVVDTGASDVVLTRRDARRLGLDPAALAHSRAYATAGGVVMAAPVVLGEMRIGPIAVARVRAAVNPAPMFRSLLGMSFLSRIGGYRVAGDTITLHAR